MAKTRLSPYGTWKSPINARMLSGKILRLMQPRLVGNIAYWVESRPTEKGRNVLVRCTPSGRPTAVTGKKYDVVSRVHEYGGGAFAVHGDKAWIVNKPDQGIYEFAPRRQPFCVIQEDSLRFADLQYDTHRNRIVCIAERSGARLKQPENSLVSIDLEDGSLQTLAAGYDFYSSPRLSTLGSQLCWLAWNHPNMPWDGTELFVAQCNPDGNLINARVIAGNEDESVFQPEWVRAGELVYVSDRSNWWNLYHWNGESRPVLRMNAEFGLPQWVFGMSTYGVIDNHTLVAAYTYDGNWEAALIDIPSGRLDKLDLPYSHIEHLHANAHGIVMLAGSDNEASGVVYLNVNKPEPKILKRSSSARVAAGYISPAQDISFPTEDGEMAHGLYYPPANQDIPAGRSEKPPLLVKCHGGPTSSTSRTLDLKIQFWTSRGFAVLDVNYRGSTGYGRAYRRDLYGMWGIIDTADIIAGARYLAGQQLVDPQRMVVSGSSAGGFTVLCALIFHKMFAAGASYYGLSELKSAMADTGKFESRYGDTLIGPLPESMVDWKERSPLYSANKLACPVIFFQGLKDEIVKPDQAKRMVDALKKKKLPVAYLTFKDEAHGFRSADAIKQCIEAELVFYGRVLGFKPAGRLASLDIENLKH